MKDLAIIISEKVSIKHAVLQIRDICTLEWIFNIPLTLVVLPMFFRNIISKLYSAHIQLYFLVSGFCIGALSFMIAPNISFHELSAAILIVGAGLEGKIPASYLLVFYFFKENKETKPKLHF